MSHNKPCRKEYSILDTLEHAYEDSPFTFYALIVVIGLGFIVLGMYSLFFSLLTPCEQTMKTVPPRSMPSSLYLARISLPSSLSA